MENTDPNETVAAPAVTEECTKTENCQSSSVECTKDETCKDAAAVTEAEKDGIA